jgi:hypothetical protein
MTHHHQGFVPGYPGIVDEDIESAEFLFHIFDERFGAFKIPYVKLNRQRSSANTVDFFSQRLRRGAVPGKRKCAIRTFFADSENNGAAYTPCPSRYDRNLIEK